MTKSQWTRVLWTAIQAELASLLTVNAAVSAEDIDLDAIKAAAIVIGVPAFTAAISVLSIIARTKLDFLETPSQPTSSEQQKGPVLRGRSFARLTRPGAPCRLALQCVGSQ